MICFFTCSWIFCLLLWLPALMLLTISWCGSDWWNFLNFLKLTYWVRGEKLWEEISNLYPNVFLPSLLQSVTQHLFQPLLVWLIATLPVQGTALCASFSSSQWHSPSRPLPLLKTSDFCNPLLPGFLLPWWPLFLLCLTGSLSALPNVAAWES